VAGVPVTSAGAIEVAVVVVDAASSVVDTPATRSTQALAVRRRPEQSRTRMRFVVEMP